MIKLNDKKIKSLISISNSFIFSIYGIYKLYLLLFNFKIITMENIDDIYMTDIFIFYLLFDIFAHIYLNIPMNLLTCKIHHSSYLIFLVFLRLHHYSHLFTIFLIEELPTFLLNLGQYDKKYRNDNLFGFTFFILRIIYHLYVYLLIYYIHHPYYCDVVFILTTMVHIFWFYNWFDKYLSIN